MSDEKVTRILKRDGSLAEFSREKVVTAIYKAAAAVGAQIGKLTGVKYDTKREKACQSPAESMRQGMASCTGLSILMLATWPSA